MGKIAEAHVRITGDDSRFQSAVKRFQTGSGRMQAAANRTGRSLKASAALGTTAFRSLAGTIASAAAVFGGFNVARGAVGTISEFGSQISKVKALTGATGAEFEALREKARQLGATTQFSASQAASGMAFLAQAGFNSNQILESSPSFLRLAAVGVIMIDVGLTIESNFISEFRRVASE